MACFSPTAGIWAQSYPEYSSIWSMPVRIELKNGSVYGSALETWLNREITYCKFLSLQPTFLVSEIGQPWQSVGLNLESISAMGTMGNYTFANEDYAPQIEIIKTNLWFYPLAGFGSLAVGLLILKTLPNDLWWQSLLRIYGWAGIGASGIAFGMAAENTYRYWQLEDGLKEAALSRKPYNPKATSHRGIKLELSIQQNF